MKRLACAVAMSLALALPTTAFADGGLSLSSVEGLPGDSVTLTTDLGDGSTCEIDWDSSVVQSTGSCGGDGQGVPLTVTGAPGTHTVTVCDPACGDADAIEEAATYVIDTVVPKLVGVQLPLAVEQLAKAGLVTDNRPIPGTVVTGSFPSAGAVVTPGTSVELDTAPIGGGTTPDNSPTTVHGSTTVHRSTHSVGSSTVGGAHTSSSTSLVAAAHAAHRTWLGEWIAAALLAVLTLAWWLRRRGGARSARHTVPAPQRVTVTARQPRTNVDIAGGTPTSSVDVQIRSTTTTTITFEDDHDH